MITQEQITLVLQHLPGQFSIGELVDKLVIIEQVSKNALPYPELAPALPVATASPAQLSPAVAALRGIARLRPEDEHKSYDELRWEAMRTKYEL